MGSEDADIQPFDGEWPITEERVTSFLIDPRAVTNASFATFIKATGYVTDAERFGWSFVFAGLVPGEVPVRGKSTTAPWWLAVEGASWRSPEGPGSSIASRQNHPVVHVSWRDAMSYCQWAGARLPTEVEWEYAARGGLARKRFPWGDDLTPQGKYRCNIWQGQFPDHNTMNDGFFGTAPVDSFGANGFGLYNMAGNVWEWCNDNWSVPRHTEPLAVGGASKVVRGGSYLCHESYCNRYRVAARTSNTPESSAGNTGFRIAADAT